MEEEYRLTTIDNPHDPFDDFKAWFRYDTIDNHYNTCNVLAEAALISDGLTDEQNKEIINNAIDDIIAHDPLHLYKKVKRTN